MYPNTEGILESSLYVADVARSAGFYEKVFGFQVISDFGERGCAMKAGTGRYCCYSRKVAHATYCRRTMATGNSISRSRLAPPRLGELGSMAGGKRNRGGRETQVGVVIAASISGIQTGISSRWLRRVSGRFIEAAHATTSIADGSYSGALDGGTIPLNRK